MHQRAKVEDANLSSTFWMGMLIGRTQHPYYSWPVTLKEIQDLEREEALEGRQLRKERREKNNVNHHRTTKQEQRTTNRIRRL